MNITLLGATGKLGQEILKQSLEKGHSIKALVRNPTKLEIQHDRLEIVQADVLHDSSNHIAMLLAGSDAVISAIGCRTTWRIQRQVPITHCRNNKVQENFL